MNYKIGWLNNNLEIENPIIEIVGLNVGNPNIHEPNFILKTYGTDVLLTVKNGEVVVARFGLKLYNIQAESMNFESAGADIMGQVVTALNSQFGVVESATRSRGSSPEGDNTVEETTTVTIKKSLWVKFLELIHIK